MSGLKVYVDTLSQPSRAILLFLLRNKIPHEQKTVSVFKGEHLDPDYVKKVHRFGKVPAIDDNGVKLIESIAILRYLARKNDVPDHWYPKDIAKQAKVDEFLEWHHIGLRSPLAMFFLTKFARPLMTGKPAKEEHIKMWQSKMEVALDQIEKVWLKGQPYLTGENISIADLIGICEIEQPSMCGYDPKVGRPNLASWMKRVKYELQPHYDKVHEQLQQLANQNLSKL